MDCVKCLRRLCKCDSGIFCGFCRSDKGKPWREKIARRCGLDVDWECPLGHAWGYVPNIPKQIVIQRKCCKWGEKTGQYMGGRQSPCFEIVNCKNPEVVKISAPTAPQFIFRHCKPQTCKYHEVD